MKTKKIIIHSIIILVIIFGVLTILNKIPEKMIENNSLKNKIVMLAESKLGNNNEVIIEFEKVTDFNWDKLYIVTPYTNIKEYMQQKNIEGVKLIDTNINTNDSDHLLVFVLNNKIISYIHYPRKKGDFNIPIKEGYTPVQAVFEVKEIEEENGWLEMNNVNIDHYKKF